MRIIFHWVLHFYDFDETNKNGKSIAYKIYKKTLMS